MQTLQNANDTFLHLLQSFAALMSERPDGAELGDKTASQCDEELRTLRSVQKALERRISLVSQKRNTFPQINNLPPELLVDIFTRVPYVENNWGVIGSNHATLSLVCHYWNRLVDTTPSLWAKIVATAMSTVKIARALEKSRDAPLDITYTTWSLDPARQDPFLNNIIPHAHRWRDVSLVLGEVNRGLDGITTASMPLLESLSLSCNGNSGWVRPEPLDLFGGRAPPKLRGLCLRGIPVPWSPTILCHLTMLSISEIRDLGPSLDQLVAVLSTCPDLKFLSISGVTFMGGASTFSPNPMHMPALERLELHMLDTETTKILLASIHAPNCISGELDCDVLGDPLQTFFTSDVSHFFDHIRSHPVRGSLDCESGIFTIIRRGPWNITLIVENITFAKATLIWLSSSSPIQMAIYGLSMPLSDILAVVADMEALDLMHFEVPVSDALTLLATGGSAQVGTPSRWPFPGLVEMSIACAFVEGDWERLALMLQIRQGAPETKGGAQHPKRLRKLSFGPGPRYPGVDEPVIANFSSTFWPNRLDEVRRLLGPEGKLMWFGRVVTEEGVLEERAADQTL